jgi:SAM-dependent methyltransferase
MRRIRRKLFNALKNNTFISRQLFRFFVWLNIVSYYRLKDFVPRTDGVHPKHAIMQYQTFFLNNLKATDSVLDVGCHYGELTEAMAGKVARVVGVDLDEEDIVLCNERSTHDNVEYVVADITTATWPEPFDVAVLSNVLEHIEDRVGLLQSLRSQANTLLLRVPLASRTWLALYLRDNGYEYRLDQTHFTEYTEAEITDELTKGGWHIDETKVEFGEFYAVCTNVGGAT